MAKCLDLCDKCQQINLRDYLYQNDYPGTIELGCFQDIATKVHCSLCRLVIQALTLHSRQHWKSGIYPVEVCYLGSYNGRSNRQVLDIWFDSTSATLPNGIFGHSTTLCQILPLSHRVVDDASEIGARASASAYTNLIGEKVDMSRVHTWMQNCTSSHGPNCKSDEFHFADNLNLSLLLIDVKDMRLIECDWAEQYIALSYVWGLPQSLRSTKANIHHLQKNGAVQEMWEELPQAITDAIELTKAMGETYLWVDALCIIQDDYCSKAVYIDRMGQIYGNAYVTLITLNSASASSALPGVSQSRVLVQSAVEINDLNLVPRLPQLFSVAQSSAWSRRAWTFQKGSCLGGVCILQTTRSSGNAALLTNQRIALTIMAKMHQILYGDA